AHRRSFIDLHCAFVHLSDRALRLDDTGMDGGWGGLRDFPRAIRPGSAQAIASVRCLREAHRGRDVLDWSGTSFPRSIFIRRIYFISDVDLSKACGPRNAESKLHVDGLARNPRRF